MKSVNKIPFRTLVLLVITAISAVSCQNNKPVTITSPNGQLQVNVTQNAQGEVFYGVNKQGVEVLKPSKLGIIRSDADFSKNLTLKHVSEPVSVTDSYTLVVHKKAQYNYTATECTLSFSNDQGLELQTIFQVSDQGVAFRYYFPESSTDVKQITAELTSFAFDSTARAWLQPCAHAKSGWGQCNPSYEEHYLQNIPVGTPSPLAGWVFPALFKTGNNWVLISEAGIQRNYCASRLAPKSEQGIYSIGFPEPQEVVFTGELNPQSTLPWASPWRILVVGSLADVVESSLGTDVVKPVATGDFSWVKPGRASWSWVLLKDGQTIYPVQKEFIDFAADMGWEYCLIDAGWDVLIGYDKIKELSDYGASKNVKIILWYNSAGDWNETPQTPKNVLLTREARLAEFTKIKAMGIAGIKVDFWGGDGQSVMNYYIDLLEDAAQVGLSINCHGSTLPRGIQRAYPNLVSMEAIKGMEFTTFDQRDADPVANHCAMIPFTRNVFDPMDFTPTCFGEIDNIKRVTSNGFELALPVLFQSGVQHYAEIPKVMNQVPAYVKQLMKDIPVVWDETKFVAGFPGEYVVLARRSADTWYVAGINGSTTARQLALDLGFMAGKKGQLVTDGATNREFVQSQIEVLSGNPIQLELQGNGGFLIQVK